MTIREALRTYKEIDETELFLSHLLKISKEQLYMGQGLKLTPSQQHSLRQMVADFKRGMPAAYLLGYKYFYGLKFKVTRATLIPRPESEWLIDKALYYIRTKHLTSLQDVGTGSGCLAISVAKQLPPRSGVKISASDVSRAALRVAQSNARKLGATIRFFHSDLLAAGYFAPELLLANLPYVTASSYQQLILNLRYEPKSALTDGTNDALLYVRLLQQLAKKRRLPKVVLFEIDPATRPILAKTVAELFPLSKFKRRRLRFFKDLNLLTRYAILELGT